MFDKTLPTNAIIAITLNCNSKCTMCDIWKNNIKNELHAKDYLKLPSSLKDINLTGGEPFLRTDIADIIKNIKSACPNARLIINTNGFLPKSVERQIANIIKKLCEGNWGLFYSLEHFYIISPDIILYQIRII